MTVTIPEQLRPEHGAFLSGGEPLVFHCHHYNVSLQKTIEEGLGEAATPLFVAAAAEVGYAQLVAVLAANPGLTSFTDRLQVAAELSRRQGFGRFLVSGDPGAGQALSHQPHYALGWTTKLGRRSQPACAFHAGFFAGAFSAAAGLPNGSHVVEEISCGAMDGGACRFVVRRGALAVLPSVGAGQLPATAAPPLGETGNVRAQLVIDTLQKLPIVGNEEGIIPAFGVYLSRHYANYYNRISYAFERQLGHEAPALLAAARLALIEAGHVCAFNTFGGIAESPEWEGLIAPMCRDKADWFHGLVACANALGWGCWRTRELAAGERATVDLYASYESNGRLAMYGQAPHASCYLATGALAGFMNLLWTGDITARPVLDEAYYSHIYTQAESFVGREVLCRAKGDPHCRVLVERRRF